MTPLRTTSAAVTLTALALACASASSCARTEPSLAVSRNATLAEALGGDDPREHRAGEVARAVEREPYAYGWPLKPFYGQHPVRGFFGDPRIANHGQSRQFHFGVDISAPNGTAVYATLTGTAYVHPRHATTVAIVGPGDLEFSYWHVMPTVRSGQRVVAYETVIGRIEKPYGHVHFSEKRNGRYLNPLRRGAMGPFVDDTRPAIRSLVVVDGAEPAWASPSPAWCSGRPCSSRRHTTRLR